MISNVPHSMFETWVRLEETRLVGYWVSRLFCFTNEYSHSLIIYNFVGKFPHIKHKKAPICVIKKYKMYVTRNMLSTRRKYFLSLPLKISCIYIQNHVPICMHFTGRKRTKGGIKLFLTISCILKWHLYIRLYVLSKQTTHSGT